MNPQTALIFALSRREFRVRVTMLNPADWQAKWITMNAGDKLQMEATIPPNTTATVYIPAEKAAAVTGGGNTIDKVEGVKFVRMENGAVVREVGAESYRIIANQVK